MRIFLCVLLVARIYAADPRLGRWTLVSAQVTVDPPMTMTFAAEGGGVHYSYYSGTQFSAKIDGHDYPVTGTQIYDQVSLRQADANTIDIVRKKGGKEVGTARYQVSAHNPNQLRLSFKPAGVNADQFFNRKGQLTNAANRVVGEWVLDNSKVFEQASPTLNFKAEGQNAVRFEMIMTGAGAPPNIGYTATLDGRDSTSLRNVPEEDSVAVSVLDATTVQDVYKRKGKVVESGRFVISNQGKTLTLDNNDQSFPGRKEKIKAVFRKE
jgi:hypothetical protein